MPKLFFRKKNKKKKEENKPHINESLVPDAAVLSTPPPGEKQKRATSATSVSVATQSEWPVGEYSLLEQTNHLSDGDGDSEVSEPGYASVKQPERRSGGATPTASHRPRLQSPPSDGPPPSPPRHGSSPSLQGRPGVSSAGELASVTSGLSVHSDSSDSFMLATLPHPRPSNGQKVASEQEKELIYSKVVKTRVSAEMPPIVPSGGESLHLPPRVPSGGESPHLPPRVPGGGESPHLPPRVPSGGESLHLPPRVPGGGESPHLPPRVPSGGESPHLPPRVPSGGESPHSRREKRMKHDSPKDQRTPPPRQRVSPAAKQIVSPAATSPQRRQDIDRSRQVSYHEPLTRRGTYQPGSSGEEEEEEMPECTEEDYFPSVEPSDSLTDMVDSPEIPRRHQRSVTFPTHRPPISTSTPTKKPTRERSNHYSDSTMLPPQIPFIQPRHLQPVQPAPYNSQAYLFSERQPDGCMQYYAATPVHSPKSPPMVDPSLPSQYFAWPQQSPAVLYTQPQVQLEKTALVQQHEAGTIANPSSRISTSGSATPSASHLHKTMPRNASIGKQSQSDKPSPSVRHTASAIKHSPPLKRASPSSPPTKRIPEHISPADRGRAESTAEADQSKVFEEMLALVEQREDLETGLLQREEIDTGLLQAEVDTGLQTAEWPALKQLYENPKHSPSGSHNQFHEQISSLEEENTCLKGTVDRLNKELSQRAHESLSLQPGEERSPRMTKSKYFTPLLKAYDERISEKDKVLQAYQDEINQLKDDISKLEEENKTLLAERQEVGNERTEWQAVAEHTKSVLEENSALSRQLELQRERMREMRKEHQARVSQLNGEISHLKRERDSIKTDLESVKQGHTHLQEQLQQLVHRSTRQVTVEEHQEALQEVQSLLEDLAEKTEADASNQETHIRIMQKEKKVLATKLADSKAIILQLEQQCTSLHKSSRKAQEKIAELQCELETSRDREVVTHKQLNRAVVQVEKALAERDTFARIAKSQQKSQEKAIVHRTRNEYSHDKLEKKLEAYKLQASSKLDRASVWLQDQEREFKTQRRQYEGEIQHLRSRLIKKQKDFDTVAKGKKSVEDQLDLVWRASTSQKAK